MKTLAIFCFLSLLSVSSAYEISITLIRYDENQQTGWRTDDEVMALYEAWLVKHGKVYNAIGEKGKRFEIFKDNLRYIDEQNSVANRTYKLGLNWFADLTTEEYRSMYLSTRTAAKRRLSRSHSDRYLPGAGDSLPDSIDWREKGAVVPVKNQGGCGSCWAFSTIASVEGINAIVTGDLISLSEQELVDCDTAGENEGCGGGLMDPAFEFIIKNGGIDTENDYPYRARDGTCDQYRKNARVVTIDDYEDVPAHDEGALRKAAASQVVSVAIKAGSRDFQLYESGIFTGKCGASLDHGVNVVGYGSENGLDYWIIRNSWGIKWGEQGYMRMQRNVPDASGLCGVATEPSYPIKKGPNPPNPGPSPPVKPPTVCDEISECSVGTTCCCIFEIANSCLAWGCCPLEGAVCCADHSSCCPHDFPVCNTRTGTCSMSKNNPLGLKVMKHMLARPIQTSGRGGLKSSY